jgi:hypothetical protein
MERRAVSESQDFHRTARLVLNGVKVRLATGAEAEAIEHIRIALCAASEVGKHRAYKITDMFRGD